VLLKDTPSRIRGLTRVAVQVVHGPDLKHAQTLSLLDDGTPLTVELTGSIPITVVEDLGDGNVRVALSSPKRERNMGNSKKSESEAEDSPLAQDFYKAQKDLQEVLDKKGIGQGSLLLIVLTAPVSSLY
jgi:hypothetical protein